ncbi:MAG: dihydrofolate reductase family protein [Nitrososphaera sp.]|jgi:dihydrofolate reductase
MGKIILHMNASLDGVVSDIEKWAAISDEMLADSLAFYNTPVTILVGSKSYPGLAEYWQTAETASKSAAERAFAKRINEIEKIVISRSKVNLVWNNSRQLVIQDGGFVREIENLRKSEGDISVEAGMKTWQLFLQNSLFDEILLFVQPIIAGHGTRLFADAGAKTAMRLISTKAYENGVVKLHYQKNV